MKPPSTRAYLLTPDSIALTDMVLNLFIFFFVSFSLLYTFSPERVARLEVTLPRASTGQAASEAVLVVTVTRDGRYYLGDRAIPEGRLAAELADLATRRSGASVVVRADEASPCRALVSVFDAGSAAGVTRMSFAVQPTETP